MNFRTEPRRGEKILAQGEGARRNPGDSAQKAPSPERAIDAERGKIPLSPLPGLAGISGLYPGLHPGLISGRPFRTQFGNSFFLKAISSLLQWGSTSQAAYHSRIHSQLSFSFAHRLKISLRRSMTKGKKRMAWKNEPIIGSSQTHFSA